MTKVLLINPRFSGFVFDSNTASIPVGVAYVGAYFREKGIEVVLVDYLTNPNADSVVEREVPSSDFVGISVMTTQLYHALQLCEKIKSIDKDIPIVFGGPHPTMFPQQTIQDSAVDFAVMDEGEITGLEFIKAYEKGKNLRGIKGLLFRKDGNVEFAGRREYMDINQVPAMDWSLFDQDLLSRLDPVPAHTSRGCIHRCKFCINSITKNRFRWMSAERVLDELESIVSKFKNNRIRFWDEDFFAVPSRARAIIKGIIDRGIDIQWETTCRVDYFTEHRVSDELMAQMKKSGCYKLSFGAESGSKRILDMITKDITPEQTLNSAKKCRQFDIVPEYSFIIGMPTETREDMNMTINLIADVVKANPNAEIIGPQPFRPYPGSELYNMCLATGWKGPETLREWAHVMEKEWNYLSPHDFPWVQNPDFVEALWPYLNYAITPEDRLLKSGVKVNKLFKAAFIIAAKARWKMKFFDFPIEFKLAKAVMGLKHRLVR